VAKGADGIREPQPIIMWIRNSKYECARWREEGSKRSHDKAMAELVKGEATWRGFWAEVKVLGGVEIDRRRAEAKGGAIYPGD
jgi:hypothetical protein